VHRCAHATALSAALLAPAGCFYTSSINDRPVADIEIDLLETPGPYYYPGTPVALSARKSFDAEDGGDVTCEWRRTVCHPEQDGQEDCQPERTELPCGQNYEFVLPAAKHDPVRVQLEVTDRDDDSTIDTETIQVANRAPEVEIGLPPSRTDHFVVTLPVEVSAMPRDPDKDTEIDLSWELLKPRGAGADVELVPLDSSGLAYRFTPDVAGIWRVDVTADDGFAQGRETYHRDVAILEDQAPCIELTLPAAPGEGRLVYGRDEGPRAFEVLRVDDDLDPHPRSPDPPADLGEPSFSWFLASPDTGGELVPVAGATAASLTIDPSVYAPGDLLQLRVEVADRVERSLPCADDESACAIAGDDCYQRLGWDVEVR